MVTPASHRTVLRWTRMIACRCAAAGRAGAALDTAAAAAARHVS